MMYVIYIQTFCVHMILFGLRSLSLITLEQSIIRSICRICMMQQVVWERERIYIITLYAFTEILTSWKFYCQPI